MREQAGVATGIRLAIPGRRRVLGIRHVVLDFNGTLATDGKLRRGVAARIRRLARLLEVIVITADTFGGVRRALAGLPVTIHVVGTGAQKRRLVEAFGATGVAAIGNGVNDVPMMSVAGLGIAVCSAEGMAGEIARVATVVVRDVNDGLDLLLHPGRLVATLRH